jgi:hypothetical protein
MSTARTLGTALPTAKSMADGDVHAASISTRQKQIGAKLVGCTTQTVGGEVRYYKTSSSYAIVTRSLAVRWFEARADGDYPINLACKILKETS